MVKDGIDICTHCPRWKSCANPENIVRHSDDIDCLWQGYYYALTRKKKAYKPEIFEAEEATNE